jgi:hypothetical protein
MKEIPVPSENSPNPYANEIQNYLYEHDDYNYKQLYGDTPPPAVQTSPATQQPETQVQSAGQVPAWQQPSYISENMYAWKKQNQPTPVLYHNQQNTSSAGQVDYAKWGENIINNQAVPNNWDKVSIAALTGFGDGIIAGTERLADGLSGGMYSSFKDKYMDNSYTNRQDRLRNMAYQAGAGYLHDAANTLLDTDSDIARYYYITKFGNKFVK